ncbi:2,3,4,5-tetrahydropyridine-2,6-dicarboxylate N-succinyltransferase [Brevundimonas sp.]|uniref:2,3,4,5-tetrahydropyridine-2,6-dicarboxylate N-succinyltransferase n=1 Tax=Brevundimonas sp. TaxID=1871086 RepID=UPI003B00F8B7
MTDLSHLESVIEAAWEDRANVSAATKGEVRDAVESALALLDSGQARVASRGEDGAWFTHQWLKKAVLLSFRLNDNQIMRAGSRGPVLPLSADHASGLGPFWDKVPNKFGEWGQADYQAAGFRSVPGAIVRQGAYIARNVVLMPSFVNIGAFVDEGSMVDAWATVGSCAQIGKNVHLSGGAGIGGVLEPLQANPTIIEDGCFIGARAEVAEGVIVREGAVLAMGVYLSASTKIVDRATGEVFRGEVPAYSVVVPGSLPDPKGGPSLYCAVIVKRVDAQTRAKTGVNELLPD